jgi:predicted GNAT family acetyltransferase
MIQAMIGDNISAGIAAGQSLVSWALMYNEGSIGVVHTVEEHRGKGLARATLVHLLQKMYSRESIEAPPYAFIDCQNTASRALFESLQFQKVADVMWMMFDLHTGRG